MREALRLGDKRAEAQATLTCAELMVVLRDVPKVKELAKQAEDLFRAIGSERYAVKSRAAVAQALIMDGDAAGGEKVAQEVLARWRQIGEKEGTATAFHIISSARTMGAPGDPVEPMLKALEIYRELGWRKHEAIILYNLAELQRGNHGGKAGSGVAIAQKTIEEALDVWRELGSTKGEASAMASLGRIYAQRGLKQDCLQMIRDRMQELRSLDDQRGQVNLSSTCLELLREFDEMDEALALGEQILAIVRQIGDRLGEAHTLSNIAQCRQKMEQFEEALAASQEALAIFQEIGDKGGEAQAHKDLTITYTAMKKPHKAPNRQQALDHLGRFAVAVQKKDTSGFRHALDALRLNQGVDGRDMGAGIAELLKDPETLDWFVETTADYFQVSREEAEEMAGVGPKNPMQRAIGIDARGFQGGGLYYFFRMGAMGYGPSFRPVQAVFRQGRPFEAEQGDPPQALAVLRDDTQEEWERVALMQAHAGVLDGALQTMAAYHRFTSDAIATATAEYNKAQQAEKR
eukprot:TRINITY_DN26921_c0_g1_i2.p1 TRINITY_DN26921_c0_g1~~TRINITY_DN26921_c0_g1_i2.p1  ORF type:complete len:519 (-),score=135.18 TRINITY_DN26921_c0_g1_i2:57-1613(-)